MWNSPISSQAVGLCLSATSVALIDSIGSLKCIVTRPTTGGSFGTRCSVASVTRHSVPSDPHTSLHRLKSGPPGVNTFERNKRSTA